MTARSVLLGLLGAAFIAAAGYFNDHVLRLSGLAAHYFPTFVYGMLFLVAMVVNPLLFKARGALRLRPAELAVTVMLMLVASSVPGSGMMRYFISVQALPMQFERLYPAWEKYELLDQLPDNVLPAGGEFDPRVMDGLLAGNTTPGQMTPVSELPWDAWGPPLGTWLPMLGLVAISVICMGLIVHRQWVTHERLRYPIVEVAESILAQEPGRAIPPLLRNRLFWMGLGAVLFVHVVNGYHAYEPSSVSIPLSVDMSVIGREHPWIHGGVGSERMLMPRLFPTLMAFAYFLAADVSFSLGIGGVAYALITALMVRSGTNLLNRHISGGPRSWQHFGSYLGMGLIIAYTGRRYYWQALRRAVGLPPGQTDQKVEGYAVWACRILAVAVVLLIWWIARLGLQWPLAILAVVLMLLIFLVVSRITAESGLVLVHAYWQPVAVMIGLLGYETLGPYAIMIAGLVAVMTTIDTNASLMPFFVNGLKLCENNRVRPSRAAPWAGFSWTMAVVIALPVTLWAVYNYGLPRQTDNWANLSVARMSFAAAATSAEQLAASNRAEWSEQLGPLERLAAADPHHQFWPAVGIGLVLVLGVSAIRLRFPRWPIHPIVFLVWASWYLHDAAPSFFLGWLIKSSVTRLGGGQRYREFKPLMLGIVAGDLLGGMLWMAVGSIYYSVRGFAPPPYHIFPL